MFRRNGDEPDDRFSFAVQDFDDPDGAERVSSSRHLSAASFRQRRPLPGASILNTSNNRFQINRAIPTLPNPVSVPRKRQN